MKMTRARGQNRAGPGGRWFPDWLVLVLARQEEPCGRVGNGFCEAGKS